MNGVVEMLFISISITCLLISVYFEIKRHFETKRLGRFKKEEKELYDHTEVIQCHKGKILMMLTDGTSLSEEIEEAKPYVSDARYCSGSFYQEPGTWYQGSIGSATLKEIVDYNVERMQPLDLIYFAGVYINKVRIKEIKLTDIQPTEKYTLTYKKFKE